MRNIGSSISGQTGDVEAGGQVVSQESVDIASSSSWSKNKNIFNKKVSNNSSETSAINKSTLAFQNGYTLKSGAGDTVLQATDITSSGAGGMIILLVARCIRLLRVILLLLAA